MQFKLCLYFERIEQTTSYSANVGTLTKRRRIPPGGHTYSCRCKNNRTRLGEGQGRSWIVPGLIIPLHFPYYSRLDYNYHGYGKSVYLRWKHPLLTGVMVATLSLNTTTVTSCANTSTVPALMSRSVCWKSGFRRNRRCRQ